MPENLLPTLIYIIPNILFGLTIHECAHAWTADRLGDPTARLMGRVTLNPIPHLDPVGTIFLLINALHGFGFGWAKPVPVNVLNLHHPRRDNVLVSAAGPVSNLILAALFGLVFRVVDPLAGDQGILMSAAKLAEIGVSMNVGLAVFNLIPLYPLDGSHVLEGLLPSSAQSAYAAFSRFGPAVLIVLIFMGSFGGPPILTMILLPPIRLLFALFTGQSF